MVISHKCIKHKFLLQWLFTFFLITLILCPGMASAAIIRVPTAALLPDGTYRSTTIQEGIDVASDGDTVLVANGTYTLTQDLDFTGKAITAQSENGADNCIIDGNNTSGIYFHSNENNNSVFKGFTLVNCAGSDYYSGFFYYYSIACNSSSPTITNCTVNNGAIRC